MRSGPALLLLSFVPACAGEIGSAADAAPDRSPDVAADVAPDVAPKDAPDASPDAPANCAEGTPSEEAYPPAVYLAPSGEATVTIRTAFDRCAPLPLEVTSSNPAAAVAAASTVTVLPGESTASLTLRGLAVGETTIQAGRATVRVRVLPGGPPACPAATPAVTGRLTAGMTVRGTAGTPLAAASVGLPTVGTDVPATDVSIRCAADQVPAGYRAVGPAVRFDPSVLRVIREMPFTVPVNPSAVPTGYEMQVELAYTSPAVRTPRAVPVADLHFTDDGSAVTFKAPRLGTWQAVVRSDLGQRRERRRFSYHGIVGFSMGAAGTAMIGTRNLDRFDFVAPLGGPIEWAYMADYIRRFHVAGFCTEAQRMADPAGCARGSSVERVPQVRDLFEKRQHFENWFYPDGADGQGGTFDRRSYVQIFRDLTRMFGNAIMPPGPSGVLPKGVPDEELTRSDAERCAVPSPVRLTNYFDAQYNPRGTYPVITFCDGQNARGHAGEWDGGTGNQPMEVSLAVDINGNGRRDAGEPVLARFEEPYRDVGADGLPSAMEPGYNAATNPDPAGDDYDRAFNPAGTEGNFNYDPGEPFDDVGVDGMRCPAGAQCPHDLGEGNARFDRTAGAQRYLDVNPRRLIATAPDATLARTEVWADGGAQDLFMFGTVANHFVGAYQQRGYGVHYYNNFAPLGAERIPEEDWPFTTLDWARMPGHVMLRYGSADATPAQILAGDGGHVGTAGQITGRLYAPLWWMAGRWPGGDRRALQFSFRADDAGRCANGYSCSFDFRSERANRTGPVSIALPPGYHDPANAGVRYPVIFVLHGYGQEPRNLLAVAFLIGNYMSNAGYPSWQRPQKFIMVFPDGRCREGDGCLRGTFYTDSPVGNARMESFFLDLYDWVDRSFRVRQPEEVEVVR
ncbi:MAG: hypothetical protein U0324_03165 [Polyangiales bacterium]